MGDLTDKDILCGMFGEQKIYTPTAIRNIIRSAPAYKGYIVPTTELERKLAYEGKKVTGINYSCVRCGHTLAEWVVPQTQKFCFHCGRKIVRLVDAPDAADK